MKPAPFAYERPETLATALTLLADGGDETRILAGGQSLVPMMNFRVAKPARLIDINRLPDLDHIRREGDEIAIGALARHADVKASRVIAEASPLMHQAYEWVAHSAVRNRGTLAGNLCHADPASEMPAIMLVLDATLVVRSAALERRIAAADFFTGLYETALQPGEMLVEIRIPVMSRGQSWGFREVSMRKGDFAWTLVASVLTINGGTVSNAAIAAAGIGDRALRLDAAETALQGKPATADSFAQAADIAANSIDPAHDALTSSAYRRDLVRSLVKATLTEAATRT
ncbi:MAG: xanthine dehydrogenase family protein subunit M [Pseudomonadota bacterium]